tara:strand:+ start:78 stop:254 length:177 start_codon:yes stop_codon:yes gene_type:complete
MLKPPKEEIQEAINKYINSLNEDELRQIAYRDLWGYYRREATADEVYAFIDEVEGNND